MADKKHKPKDNLIDLASERQRMHQRAQSQKSKDRHANRGAQANKSTKKSGSKLKGGGSRGLGAHSKIQWYHYLQLILFLMVFAYFMQLCKGG